MGVLNTLISLVCGVLNTLIGLVYGVLCALIGVVHTCDTIILTKEYRCNIRASKILQKLMQNDKKAQYFAS